MNWIFFQDKAKICEKAQFTIVNEHFELIFNAVLREKTFVQSSRTDKVEIA